MINRKYYPFERSSYYQGKLLTARDLQSEQQYINDKRRLMNRLGGANGIVSGLGVIMADDSSIILQAGCAMDASGREIVVPETKVLKLSTLDGYNQLTTDSALLRIAYQEQPADQVYAVMDENGGGVQFNKIREQYALTLVDENLTQPASTPLEEYVQKTVLYADSDVEFCQYTPKFTVEGCDVTVRVELTRTSLGQGSYGLLYTLDTEGFTNVDGNSSTEVSLDDIQLEHGKPFEQRYTFYPQADMDSGAGGAMTLSSIHIRRGEETFALNQKIQWSLKSVDAGLTDFYLHKDYSKAMDKTLSACYDDRLWIARITLIRQNNAAILAQVTPAPFGQYCYNAQQLMTLRRLEEYYPSESKTALTTAAASQKTPQPAPPLEVPNGVQGVSGVFDLPLGLGYDPRVPIISQEIMHGLGKGSVYVEAGVEYVTNYPQIGEQSEVILGNASIFAQDAKGQQEERIYNLSTAIKLLPDRGTFQVGVQLGAASGVISLRIRWYAVRLEQSSQKPKQKPQGERMLLVNPDTIVLQPKGTALIAPTFINMPSEACKFSIADEQGGSVDHNGLYTAPSREGVYEVRVEALSDPTVYTHVFIIVTEKKKD